MNIDETLSTALNNLDHYLADEEQRGSGIWAREDALYTLMTALRWDGEVVAFSPDDAAGIVAGDMEPLLAAWQRWEQEADADRPAPVEVRIEYIARLTAMAHALHILDTQVVPLLDTALRPLTPLVLKETLRRLEDYLDW